ncbi:MAG: hypothetical protein ABIZ04_25100 [Opitutus sp.]
MVALIPVRAVEDKITNSVQDFVRRNIVSVEQLEILLLLFAERERDWSAAEVNSQIRSQESSVSKWLTVLASIGLVARVAETDRYKFAASSAGIEQQTAALAQLYKDFRVRIIELIYSRPGSQLRDFSNAFNLRKPL